MNITGRVALVQINVLNETKVFCDEKYNDRAIKAENGNCLTCGKGIYYDVINENEITQLNLGINYYFDTERSQLSEKSLQRLQTIYSEADRLGEIVTQLMDYTYGRKKETEMTAVDVGALLKSAESILKPICAKRENRFLLSMEGRYLIHGNYELLLQVLINLIVNASRHTENGSITVKTEKAGDLIAFIVADTGNGIAPEDVPHIFEKGYTSGNGRGLGLTICMETIRLHGGTLELVSTGPTGTTFRFTIPREDAK